MVNEDAFFNVYESWKAVVDVTASDVKSYPVGPPIHIYLFFGSEKRHIANTATFNACQFSWRKVQTIQDRDLHEIAIGETILIA